MRNTSVIYLFQQFGRLYLEGSKWKSIGCWHPVYFFHAAAESYGFRRFCSSKLTGLMVHVELTEPVEMNVITNKELVFDLNYENENGNNGEQVLN